MSEFNLESVDLILTKVVNIQSFCLEHKEIFQNDKRKMLELVENAFPHFYDQYPRICRMILSGENLDPLFQMIQLFGKVQTGNISFEKANDIIVNGLNARYVNPILDSEQLVKEREEKMRKEQNN